MQQPPAIRIGMLLGSSRKNGNNAGIASWVRDILYTRLNQSGTPQVFDIVVVSPATLPRPFGPVIDATQIPAQVFDPSQYDSEAIRDWSRFVSSCSGFVVVTPQYNAGYPGELKNAIDHLYNEWLRKPVMIVTFGGHGGGKCATQLQTVFNHLRMQVILEPVCIWLPRSYICEGDRVSYVPGCEFPDFLAPYTEPVKAAADQLKDILITSPAVKQPANA